MSARRVIVLAMALVVGGCATSHGPVGLLGAAPDTVGVKLLRPGVTGRSCRSAVFGLPLGDGHAALGEALAQILALDQEGNVVTNADVSWDAIVTGVYNRRCVELRGDLGRTISTITLPAPPAHGRH